MDRTYLVKGVNPTGRIVVMQVIAPSAMDAKRQAEEAGLRFVVVGEDPDVPASPPLNPQDPD